MFREPPEEFGGFFIWKWSLAFGFESLEEVLKVPRPKSQAQRPSLLWIL